GSFFYDQMKQNDPFLPYTLNTAIVGLAENGSKFDPTNPANLPARSLNGKVNTTSFTGNAGNRFGPFDLTLRYRYYDYADKTPRLESRGSVRSQAVGEAIGRINAPYSYPRQNAGAELGWQVHPTTRLALVYDNERWDRKFREVKDTDENTFTLTA